MDSDTGAGSADTGDTGAVGEVGSRAASFSERLTVPSVWHIGSLLFAGLAGSYPGAYFDPAWARVLVYLAVFAVVEAGLWWYGHRTLLTSDGVTFRAAGRRVPVARIAGVTVVDDIRTVLVPNTFAVTRPWIRGGVLLTVHDAEPHDLGWVLSSRRGEELAAAVCSSPAVSPGEPVG